MKKLFMVALISVSMASVHAGNSLPPLKDKEITVVSLGVENDAMLFSLKYENLQGDKLSITIVDKEGTNLYKDILSDKNISKTFRIPADLGTVFLIVTNINDKNQHKFEIASERRYVENVVITNIH